MKNDLSEPFQTTNQLDAPYKVLGSNIKLARERCGLTQHELAEMLDYSTNYQSQIECGIARQSLKRLFGISYSLQVPVESLVSGCTVEMVQEMQNGKQQQAEALGALMAIAKNFSPDDLDMLLEIAHSIRQHRQVPNGRSGQEK